MRTNEFVRKDVIVPGLKNEYRILHITDSHVVMCNEKEGEYIIEGDNYWNGTKIGDYTDLRNKCFLVDGVQTDVLFEKMCDELAANPDCADIIVFTGDIIDFFTQSAFDFIKRNIDKLKTPYMFVLGNHDMIFSGMPEEKVRNIFKSLTGENTDLQKRKLGELTLIGVYDGPYYYPEKSLNDLMSALEGEENVILFQHVPLSTKEFHKHYADLGKPDWSIGDQGVCEGDGWKTVFAKVQEENSPIKAIICGDCHIEHESKLGNVPQYTSPLNTKYPPYLYVIHS
ncbi:MAG: metallophosphoesterase [Clostridia bacterium]|nr:metallophosphoesterase [Clostridia bacterium]